MKKDYQFINVNDLCEQVTDVLIEEGNGFADYYTNIDRDCILDICDAEGARLANSWAKDFIKYCNQEDTRIWGNFNNVKWDYEREFEGKSYRDILAKLNAHIEDEDTKQFRDWAVGWFFETFGTYGMKYNFITSLQCFFSEEIEEFEKTA